MTSLQSRLLVSAIGVPLLLVIFLALPVAALEITLALLSLVGAYEILHCVGAAIPLQVLGALTAPAMLLLPRFVDYEPCIVILLVLVLALFALAVWQGGEIKFLHILTTIFAATGLPAAFSAFLRLYDMGLPRAYLLLPLIFSFASDTGAYFTGRAIGKTKLAPKVSPNKTVEGAVGGILGNILGGIIFALVVNRIYGSGISLVGCACAGLVCSVVAQLGDLSFSLIKREFGVKDYGHIFLAHGGVLDRFDSVLFVAPVIAMLLPLVV